MNRKHVNFVYTDHSIHNAIRGQNDFTDLRVAIFGNHPTRVWKVLQPIYGVEQTPHDHCGVVRGVRADECVDRRQVVLRALGPLDGHARKRFLTSS